MPQPFAITTPATHARLDAERRAEIIFTVSNMTAGPVDGRARVETADPAAGTWFSLVGEIERRFPVASTEQYVVQMAVPAQAPPGQYAFRLSMVDVENPDEGYAEGPAVTFEVPALEPSRPFPWWIVAAGGGVLALAAVIVFILWPRPRMPDLADLPFGDAQATLAVVGLSVAETIEVAEADAIPGCVAASTPAAGERVTSRSTVVLAVAAASTKTPLPPPVARFQGDPRSGDASLKISFKDLSEGEPTTWHWEFGDGGIGTSRNPVHTYQEPGSYTVRLTVSNTRGESTKTESDYIIVVQPAPQANFTAKPTSGAAPLQVIFQKQSFKLVSTRWLWEFGDGSTSTEQNPPAHTYTNARSYIVKLTASNSRGSSDKTITIQVEPPALKADFRCDPQSGKVPLQVRCQDLSKGNPTTWRWEFGSGSVYTKQLGSNIYLKPGKYTVKLTVTNAQGSTDTKEVRDAVVVQELPPCVYTMWVSEEGDGPPATCPVGYLATGVKCRDSKCDGVSLYCCPYMDGTDMGEQPPYWSGWFSEEFPNYAVDQQGWVKSIRCRGSYCDDLSLQFVHNNLLPNSQICNWMPEISEEQKDGAKCPKDWFVSGMQCTGSNCDNVSIYCCQQQ